MRGIDPQRAQRGVIPGQFVIGGQAGERLGGRAARVEQDARVVVGPGKGFESVERMRGDHQNDDAVALRNERPMAQKKLVRRRSSDDRDKLLQDFILLGERQCVGRRGVETVESDNDVDPIVLRRERHLDFGYDPVGPISVHGLVQILSRQFERARFGLERQDAQAQHIAEIAQAPPGDRADAAGSSGDEAGDRRGSARRREHPQFLSGSRARLVDVDQQRARLADDASSFDRPDVVHLGEVQEHPAHERHRLAIIAGPRAARGHRNPELVGGCEDGSDFGFACRRNDDVGGDRVEFALQHRRIPEEIAALLLDQDGIVLPLDRADLGAQRGDVISPAQGARPSRASSSE